MVTTQEILKRTGLKTQRTLTAWHKAGLIPRPRIMKHPSGRGTVAMWPDEVMERCVELATLRKPGRPSRETILNLKIIQLLEQAPIRQGLLTPEEVILANTANDGDMINREDDLPEFFTAMIMPSLFPYFPDAKSQAEIVTRIRTNGVFRQALELYRAGSNPILVVKKHELQVIAGDMVSQRLAEEASTGCALVMVPLSSLLKKAFLVARTPFPAFTLASSSPANQHPNDPTTIKSDAHNSRSNGSGKYDLPHAGSDGEGTAEG